MIENVEQLKKERPDLVELWSKMSKEELYDEIFKESLDAINMEERCQVFMNECTNLSKTTYTTEVIRGLIHEKSKQEISDFCRMAIEDTEGMNAEEIREYLKEEII